MSKKKYLITILILSVFLVLVGFTINDVYSFTKGMKRIDTDTIVGIINSKSKEKIIVMFSRDSCTQCIEYFPTIKKALEELPKDYYVYYYDTELNRNDNYFNKVSQELNVQYVPTIILLEEGKVKLNIQGDILSDKNQIVNIIINQSQNI